MGHYLGTVFHLGLLALCSFHGTCPATQETVITQILPLTCWIFYEQQSYPIFIQLTLHVFFSFIDLF